MTQPQSRLADQPNRRIAISGASGFLGRALATRLQRENLTIQRLRRGERATPPDIAWRPDAQRLDDAALDGVDAVVNLAGEQIARRWTPKRKRAIRDSRVDSTTLLSRSIAELPHPPRVFVSGSATGETRSWMKEALLELIFSPKPPKRGNERPNRRARRGFVWCVFARASCSIRTVARSRK
jgi:NAD dependent epimerase/dehydratase family enzyme